MNDNPMALKELREMHHLLNEVLGAGFRYIVVLGVGRDRSYLHAITPDWLARCTMMAYRADHTLCTNPIARQVCNGYTTIDDRMIYTEIPPQEAFTQKMHICGECLAALRDEIWPLFQDDEVFIERRKQDDPSSACD